MRGLLRWLDPSKPFVLSPVGDVRWTERVRLVLEIVVTYVPLLRLLRGNDLHAMVAGAS